MLLDLWLVGRSRREHGAWPKPADLQVRRRPAQAMGSVCGAQGPCAGMAVEGMEEFFGTSRSSPSRREMPRPRSTGVDTRGDAALAMSLQAEETVPSCDALVHLQQEWALNRCRAPVWRAAEQPGMRPQRLEEPSARPPLTPMPLEDEVASAAARLGWALSDYGLVARDITGDGACQFRAVADQIYKDQELHGEVRARAVQRLRAHPHLYSAFAVGESFEAYVTRMAEPRTWGDNLSLQAIADVYAIRVCILSSFPQRRFLHIDPMGGPSVGHQEIWLGFYAEYHYTSLEPAH